MCVLCRDTFSRSDILKRHFQKCSIRRGNPTGVSHLSHAQAHLKKAHGTSHKSNPSVSTATSDNGMLNVNGMGSMNNGTAMSYGVVTDVNSTANLTEGPAQHLSRSNSLKSSNMGTGTPNTSTRSSIDQGFTGGMPSSMSSGMNSAIAYSLPNGQANAPYSQNFDFPSQNSANQIAGPSADTSSHSGGRTTMSVYTGGNAAPQQQPGVDWSHMFPHGAQAAAPGGFMTYGSNMADPQMASIKYVFSS
jgi:hypothetical protein